MVSGSHLQAGEMAILFTPAQGGVAEATVLTLKDPLFLADAEKTMLEVDPITGDAMECMMKDAYRHPNSWFNGPRNSPRDRRGESNCTWHRCPGPPLRRGMQRQKPTASGASPSRTAILGAIGALGSEG
jgi:hypothetical protein